jgi:arylsulfatase A-like enzyme
MTVGAWFANRAETAGLDRNAVFAFITSCFSRIAPSHAVSNWRMTDAPARTGPELSHFRGSMAGRNVIVIILESTAAQYLSLSRGGNVDQTPVAEPMPNLSQLASDAIIADNAYCVYPESIKGLFSVLCSRYPAFDTPVERLAQMSTPSVAQVLRRDGYHTGLFHSGRFMYLGMDAIVENRGFEIAEDAGAISGNFNSSFGVDEQATVKRMLSWIDQINRGEKFFLMYLPIAGHHPYDTPRPGPYPVRGEQDRYLNALHYGDRSLGEFFRGLKQRGMFTNTLFVIFGDHGEAFGQHDGNYAHTFFLYEENVHVPCIIAAPGGFSGQMRLTNPASLIDITPTILDLLGINIPATSQGSSLLEATPRASLFYTDYSLPLIGLRDGDWKFIGQIGAKRNQLYNLAIDPREQTNLSARFPERVASYRQRLGQWSSAQKARYTE